MIRVLLVDDHSLLREGLRKLLEIEPDIEVVGEVGDGLGIERVVGELKPDVVLMDISMQGSDGVSATRALLSRYPNVAVIVLTMHSEETVVFQAVRAGARGYLLKSARASEVANAIRVVHSGASLLDPVLATRVLDEFRRLSSGQGDAFDCVAGLTEIETNMLRLVASGLSNREIAERMSFADATVKNRLSVVFDKIGAENRTQAAIFALTHGIALAVEPESGSLVEPPQVGFRVGDRQPAPMPAEACRAHRRRRAEHHREPRVVAS